MNAAGGAVGGNSAGFSPFGFANPEKPSFETVRDSEGNLKPELTSSMGGAYSALRDKAMTEGDTRSAGLMRNLANQNAMNLKDQASRMNASGLARAQDQLAMRGGLRSGAAERLATQGQRGLMRDFQNIGRQQGLDNLNISLQDENMKNRLLGQVAPAEQTIQDTNINRMVRDIDTQNVYKQQQYDTDKRSWAAGMTANSQLAAADQPGLFSRLTGGLF